MSNEYSPGKTIFTLIVAFGVIVLLAWAIISTLNSARLEQSPEPNPAAVQQSPYHQFERPDNYRNVPQTNPNETPQSDSKQIDKQSYLGLFGQIAMIMLSQELSSDESESVSPQKLTFN